MTIALNIMSNGGVDITPGSLFRGLLESWFGPNWNEYTMVYIDKRPGVNTMFRGWMLHNEDGPATVKSDGTMEWWLNGDKLFCKTQQEFECYMRNKAFW